MRNQIKEKPHMSIRDENYSQILNYIKKNEFPHDEKEEQDGDIKRIDVKHGKFNCTVKVYSTGTVQVQGQNSKLKESLEKAKHSIENEEEIHELLPFEIEKFPDTLKTNIPNIDLVIVKFIEEAITALKSGSLLGSAFLLGAASEKTILNLISTFGDAIQGELNKQRFKSRTKGKFISKAYSEFVKSFKGCKTKPTTFNITQDLDIKMNSIFQFCRICRNEVGHPQIVPNLDKGVILANMGQFVKYVESVYGLIKFYEENETEL